MKWFILLFMPSVCFGQSVVPAVGQWREHLPYQHATDVTASKNNIIAATPYSLFTIDRSTKEVTRISKVSGLSETGISRIAYDMVSEKLFIGYSNSNIDVIANGRVHNIPALMRYSAAGDKKIYHIYPDQAVAYFSTGVGVLVMDAVKYEMKETWLLGNSGNSIAVYGFLKAGNRYYAATEEGLKSAPVNANHADFRNWMPESGRNGLSIGATLSVDNLNNRVAVLQNDSIFIQSGQTWQHFYSNTLPIQSMKASENKLMVFQRNQAGAAQVVILNGVGQPEQIIRQPGYISFPMNGIQLDGAYWIADLYGGLSHWRNGGFESYRLNSPQDISTGSAVVFKNQLLATAGAVNNAWNYQYNPNGFFRFENNIWTNFNRYTHPVLDSVYDIITVAADPRDGSAWLGSFGGGLVHLNNADQWHIYKQSSPLQAAVGDPGSYRVAGLAFDADNNLWISNFGSAKQLHVLRESGEWQSFSIPFTLRENAVADIIIDEAGVKWIVSPLGNGVIVFDAGDLNHPADDTWKLLKTGAGMGNLPSADVLSIAKDRSGLIWIGTNNGVAVIECPELIFGTGCDAVWPVIKEGAFSNYLFKGQEVRSIATDGADRKWMATATGAWLISASGDKVLNHFTEENSPLLSNDVRNIAIDGSSGEVYFTTAKGIISYRGEATEATAEKSEVVIFPNPVPPGYSGSIGIRGLPENSIVKITELNGRLVHQTRSLGGQAVWNGKDYHGRTVATGVYLVIVIDEKNRQNVAGKIVIVSK